MSTVRDLSTDILEELMVSANGQTPDAGDLVLVLSRLNNLIDLYSIEGLMIFSENEDLYLLPANTQSPTLGASGSFSGTRPVEILAANAIDVSGTILGTGATTGAGDLVLTDNAEDFVAAGVVAGRDLVYVVSGTGVTAGIYRIATVAQHALTLATNPGSSGSAIVYRVIVIPERQEINVTRDVHWWAQQRTRGTSGVPTDLFANPTFPNLTLNFYPLAVADVAIELFTKVQLASFASLDTTINLPNGYYSMLLYNGAVDCCEPFEKTPTPLLLAKASESRAKVKSANRKKYVLRSDVPMGSRW